MALTRLTNQVLFSLFSPGWCFPFSPLPLRNIAQRFSEGWLIAMEIGIMRLAVRWMSFRCDRAWCFVAGLLLAMLAFGCGTTRWSDTTRTATEQLVVSHSIDQAISRLDFSLLAGKRIFFEEKYLDGVTDKGYIASSIRQQILASGCLLQEDRAKAEYVIEARCGASGTDRHDQLLLGTPQLALPSITPGMPSMIPEIPLIKKTHQVGAAKIAVFAYNRTTGEPVWQSGIAQFSSTAKNYWLFGAGPFQGGKVRKKIAFGGGDISVPGLGGEEDAKGEYPEQSLAVATPKKWPETAAEPASIQTAGATISAPVLQPATETKAAAGQEAKPDSPAMLEPKK